MDSDKFSWKARGRSFRYAAKGISTLFKHEHNARIHLCVAIAVILCGFILRISVNEWCLVSICIGSVLAAEGFNSAIETLADKISPDYDPLIGKAKDLAAGAVLLTVGGVVITGLIIFIPKLTTLICR
ncbi:MAG: diacylglycerol kinase family protein [Muribaculum sp.]|nr:diacylglycerol kinase family protein [Muribaculum sp.]